MLIKEILDKDVSYKGVSYSIEFDRLRTLMWGIQNSRKSEVNLKSYIELNIRWIEALTQFTNKESYLKWVADWKSTYKSLVEMQKDLKKKIKTPTYTTQILVNGKEFRTSDQPENQSLSASA